MNVRAPIDIVYVTSSRFKRAENEVYRENHQLSDGTVVKDIFRFDIREVTIKEVLEVDIRLMVTAEVTSAYGQLKVPCIVEHAGLVFEEYVSRSYPGGLTKPMWDTLRENFVSETGSSDRRAIARAVVAYCDGKSIHTFVGETAGTIAKEPRGSREFYWDTVFIPDTDDPAAHGRTYAQIVDDDALGLTYKMKLSQSAKAMSAFLEYRRLNWPDLWDITY
jgi:inosine/xanthosine triphosphate pyrophosphatase family protein